jgi:CBS domain-containing protein
VAVLESRRLSELPVVDAAGHPLGLLDIVDLVGLTPADAAAPVADVAAPSSGAAAA